MISVCRPALYDHVQFAPQVPLCACALVTAIIATMAAATHNSLRLYFATNAGITDKPSEFDNCVVIIETLNKKIKKMDNLVLWQSHKKSGLNHPP
jgi:hypothetical protein